MGELLPMPRTGDVFTDARGDDRTMRISWHAESGVAVVSLWAGRLCRASFRLPVSEIPRLIAALGPMAGPAARAGLADPGTADPGTAHHRTTRPGPADGPTAVVPAVTDEPDITVTVSQEPASPPPAWPPPAVPTADSEAS